MNEMISTFLSGPAFASLLNSALTLAIGLAWAVQELPSVPAEPTDQPLDLIVTDRDIRAAAG